jgi:hypothetical protein
MTAAPRGVENPNEGGPTDINDPDQIAQYRLKFVFKRLEPVGPPMLAPAMRSR